MQRFMARNNRPGVVLRDFRKGPGKTDFKRLASRAFTPEKYSIYRRADEELRAARYCRT
jgi:hypothetical protein